MRRTQKRTFAELVSENKQELLKDSEAIQRIEERLEEKYAMKAVK
ncbi:FbpB family small basic protein [Bacillus fonticola]|nr:FbpB family small basic protein [Bacillus fonticola]